MSDFSSDDEELSSTTELEEKFNKAADYIQNVHSQLSPEILLEIYGLYKQATTGPCNISKPSIFNIQGKAKWNAWNDLGEMPKSQAMQLYVEKVIKSGWSGLPSKKNTTQSEKSQWVCHSIPVALEEDEVLEANKNIFDFVKENDLEKLKFSVNPKNVNKLDETGLGLIHWATDRNSISILQFLLENCKADVNLRDSEQQTALHYASSCGHLNCISVLLSFGADKNLLDDEGQTCLDVAFDENVKILLNT